jgi:hypothetical protein
LCVEFDGLVGRVFRRDDVAAGRRDRLLH